MDGNSFYFDWEISLIETLQSVIPGPLLMALTYLSAFGEEFVLIAVIGFLFWCRDKETGKKVGLSVLMAACLNPFIKNIFLRRRPYFESDKIELLRKIEKDADAYDIAAQGFSFPSGHSTNAAAVFGILARLYKHKAFKVLAVVIPLLVAFSRVVAGAHFPTDVLVGLLMGYLAVLIVPFMIDKIKNKILLYGIFAAVTLPGIFFCTSDDYFTTLGLLIGFIIAEPFEARFVNFKPAEGLLESVIRIAGGTVVYLVLNALLKLPFSKEFLTDGSFAAHMVRFGRYLIIIFVAIAIYPMLFKFIHIKKKNT